MALASQWLPWPKVPEPLRWLSLLYLGLGVTFAALGAYATEPKRFPAWVYQPLARFSARLGVSPVHLACLGISPLLSLLAALAAGDGVLMISFPLSMMAWGLAIGLVLIGTRSDEQFRLRLPPGVALWTVGLIVVAFLIRGIGTARAPTVLTGDEGSTGLSALNFITGQANNLFSIGWRGFPALYFFIQSLSIRLFGQTSEALRLPSALVGAVTVGGLYLMGRAMFGHRAALLGAIFLAAFHYHLHFSRIGLNNIWDGLAYVITLGLLWRGWQTGARAYFVWAGLALGLAQYFYPSSRMLLALVPAWVLIAGVLDRARLKQVFVSLWLMAFTTMVVVLPLAWYFSRHWNDFMGPMRAVSILGPWLQNEMRLTGQPAWQILLRQISLGFQGFTATPLKAWYRPGTPMLRPFTAGFFLIGISLLLVRPRDARMLLLGLWLSALAVVVGLSESTPAAQRYVAAAPACALVVGYGLGELARRLGNSWPRQAQWFGLLAFAFMVGLAADDLRFYYLQYTPHSDFGDFNTTVANRLAQHLQDKSEEWQVLFFGAPRMGYRSISSLQYLAPHIQGLDINQPWGAADNPQPTSQHLIFVFLPGHEADLAAVHAAYPGGRLLQENWQVDGSVLYFLYEYPAASP
ncbi:MAG: glycosyltransferase family 39 protein [Anaerolineales bacterium]